MRSGALYQRTPATQGALVAAPPVARAQRSHFEMNAALARVFLHFRHGPFHDALVTIPTKEMVDELLRRNARRLLSRRWRAAPPASRRRTRNPARARFAATGPPPAPEPTTMYSYSSGEPCAATLDAKPVAIAAAPSCTDWRTNSRRVTSFLGLFGLRRSPMIPPCRRAEAPPAHLAVKARGTHGDVLRGRGSGVHEQAEEAARGLHQIRIRTIF